jgi:selenocysteine lyase/cysteine desulfurase
VKLSGAKLVTVPLRVVDGQWQYDPAELAAAFSPRTRLVIVNSVWFASNVVRAWILVVIDAADWCMN